MPVSGPADTVLRGFISASNAQYRKAGLDQYQMRVERDGSVHVPRNADGFKAPSTTGTAAASQASAGAAAKGSAPTAGAAPGGRAPASVAPRSGAALTFTSLKPTAGGFALRWDAVPGAARYGIYVDGALVGHVTKAAFDGTVAGGSGGVIQVDAVAKDGTRTPLTAAMLVTRTAKGELRVTDPTKAAAAAAAAPAPAATTAAATAPAAAAQ